MSAPGAGPVNIEDSCTTRLAAGRGSFFSGTQVGVGAVLLAVFSPFRDRFNFFVLKGNTHDRGHLVFVA